MTQRVIFGQEKLGRIWLPEISVSRPGAPTRGSRLNNICTASWMVDEEVVWADITHNSRVDIGAAVQYNRLFGASTGFTGGANVANSIAVGYNSLAGIAKTDLAIANINQGNLTNEVNVAALGASAATMVRKAGTLGSPTAYTGPSALDGTATIDTTATFTSIAGFATVCTGSGLFDSNTTATGQLWCEAAFSTSASPTGTDTLQITWTITM